MKTEAKTAILKTSSQRNRLYMAPSQNLLSKILKYLNIFKQTNIMDYTEHVLKSMLYIPFKEKIFKIV